MAALSLSSLQLSTNVMSTPPGSQQRPRANARRRSLSVATAFRLMQREFDEYLASEDLLTRLHADLLRDSAETRWVPCILSVSQETNYN